MADEQKKISELDAISLPPGKGDYFVLARENVNNFRISYSELVSLCSGYFLGVDKIDYPIDDQNLQYRIGYPVEFGDDVQFSQSASFSGPLNVDILGKSRFTQDALYITGDQNVEGIKTFSDYIVANISGTSTGVLSGVYTTGNQDIGGFKNFTQGILISGKPIEASVKPEEVLMITGFEQIVSGSKIFHNFLIPRGGISTTGKKDSLIIKSQNSIIGYPDAPDKSLTLAFESGVYVTGSDLKVSRDIHAKSLFSKDLYDVENIKAYPGGGMVFSQGDFEIIDSIPKSLITNFEEGVYITGSDLNVEKDLHVGGKLTADEFSAVDTLVGLSGGMILTDGRDPGTFDIKDDSLTLAFESGVYVTGSDLTVEKDLYVGGKIVAEEIDAVDTLVGLSGGMILTDGRDPGTFDIKDDSLTLAFESGVYVTGSDLTVEKDLYVGGKIVAEEIDAVDTLVGLSGGMILTDGRDPGTFDIKDDSLTLAFESGVYVTGSDLTVEKDLYVGGKIVAEEIDAVDTLVGLSGGMILTDGRDPGTFDIKDDSLTLAFESGVYVTGSDLTVEKDLYVGGKIVAEEIDAVDTLVGLSGGMILTDGRDPGTFDIKDDSLTLAFESGVYVTGSDLTVEKDLYVGGKIVAEEIDAVDTLVGLSGGMILTDGRDPGTFDIKDDSLTLAFESGVYVTGSDLTVEKDLYVGGKIVAEEIDAVDTLVGLSGGMILTDGRDPGTFDIKDDSLTLAFESGVYVTGSDLTVEKDLYVGGKIVAEEIDAVDTLVGLSGGMILTDGRDPGTFDIKDDSLTLAFESGVYVTGSDLTVEKDLYVGGKIVAEEIDAVDTLVGLSGGMILTDGRDPGTFDIKDDSLTLAFESGVYVTGSDLTVEKDLYVGGKIVAEEIDAVDTLVGLSGGMILTDGRDPGTFDIKDDSLTLAFESGVYITGSDLFVEGSIHFNGDTTFNDLKEVKTIVGYPDETVVFTNKKDDPNLYNVKDGSLSIAFESGVYITGSKLFLESGNFRNIENLNSILSYPGGLTISNNKQNLYNHKKDSSAVLSFESGVYITGSDLNVEKNINLFGNLKTSKIENLENIISYPDIAFLISDGLNNNSNNQLALKNNSATMSFERGVYITGSDLSVEKDLYVGGKIVAEEIDAVDTLVGLSGGMILTDGRDPGTFDIKDDSLTLAFESGVYVTGSDLTVEKDLYVGDLIKSKKIHGVENFVAYPGGLIISDGRDVNNLNIDNKSINLAFESGVYITGSNLFVENDIISKNLEAKNLNKIENIISYPDGLVITDQSDFNNYNLGENSLSIHFESGVYVTGSNLTVENDLNLGGNISLQNISGNGKNINITGSSLTVDKEINVGSVHGYKNNLNINSNLNVSDHVNVSGDINVSGVFSSNYITGLNSLISYPNGLVLTNDTNLNLKQEGQLTLAFESGVYITGSTFIENDFYVGNSINSKHISGIENIVAYPQGLIITDLDHQEARLHNGGNNSLTLNFQSGVYITGTDLNVGGNVNVDYGISSEYISVSSYLTGLNNLSINYGNGINVSGSGLNVDNNLSINKSHNIYSYNNNLVISGSNNVLVTGSDFIVNKTGYFDDIVLNKDILGKAQLLTIDSLYYTAEEGKLALVEGAGVNNSTVLCFYENGEWISSIDGSIVKKWDFSDTFDLESNSMNYIAYLADDSYNLTVGFGNRIESINSKDNDENRNYVLSNNTSNYPNLITSYLKPGMYFDAGNNEYLYTTENAFGKDELSAVTIAVVYEINEINEFSPGIIGGIGDSDLQLDGESALLRVDNTIDFGGSVINGSLPTGRGSFVRVATRSLNHHSDYINGVENINLSFPDTPTKPLIDGNIVIGASSALGGNHFNGIVKEFVILEGMIDYNSRIKLEGYLSNKWYGAGSNNKLPSSHPFKNYIPMYDSSVQSTYDLTIDGGSASSNY